MYSFSISKVPTTNVLPPQIVGVEEAFPLMKIQHLGNPDYIDQHTLLYAEFVMLFHLE